MRDLTVVIPIGPLDRAFPPGLAPLAALAEEAEVILVFADRPGGEDWPRAMQPVVAPRGRSSQLNAGAALATRGYLWFLHADTTVLPAALQALAAWMDSGVDGLGYFRLAFASDAPRLTGLNAWGANWRSRWLGLPFGDQGLVVKTARFHALGGFAPGMPVGEDLEFVMRARAAAVPLCALPATLVTSGRRYREAGWFPTTCRHLLLTATLSFPLRPHPAPTMKGLPPEGK